MHIYSDHMISCMGFLKWIAIVVIIIAVGAYFGLDTVGWLREGMIIESEIRHEAVNVIEDLVEDQDLAP